MHDQIGAAVRPYPHIYDWRSSAKMNYLCALSLAPVLLWSLVLYGAAAASVWASAAASALLCQAAVDAASGKLSVLDGSSLVTGLLVATIMPPGAAWYMPASASAFAVLVVRGLFGGYGKNWMNPALAGVAFAFANWPEAMRSYLMPRALSGVDGLSGVSPIGMIRDLDAFGPVGAMDALRQLGYPLSAVDGAVTGFLNDAVFLPLGARLPEGYVDLLLGLKPGALGDGALIAVLAGSVLLLSLRSIKWTIPLFALAPFVILVRAFGLGLSSESFMQGDVLFALSGGGVFLASFYMATDPVCSPVRRGAQAVYGLIIGVLFYVFRRFGAFADGAVYAILIANVLCPSLERRLPEAARLFRMRRSA